MFSGLRRTPTPLWVVCWFLFSLLATVNAQSTSHPSSASPTPSTGSSSLSLTTSYVTIVTTIQSGSLSIPISSVIPSVYNVSVAVNSTPSASPSPSATPIVLDTKVDAAFGVVGAILILTGLPSAFLGHKNRWSSFFIIGFYTLSLVCLVLIFKFGVMVAINPPTETLRGLFVLACGVAGVAGGGAAIFFWKGTKYFVGAWGGLAFALWIECFRDGGLISPIGYRWIMYIGVSAIGFILCTLPKIHYYILLISTAFVGATSFMLGVDCYTTAGLKEFYLWNLGFDSFFTKFTSNGIKFPVSQTMQIELGLMGAISLMGMAVQFQVLRVLLRKLKEINEEQRRRNEEEEARAAEAFVDVEREKDEWDRQHPTLSKHGRMDSSMSSPLLKEDEPGTPDERRSSAFTLVGNPRQRYHSGVSDFLAAPPSKDELDRRASQSPGALPMLDLGRDIEADVPQDYISVFDDPRISKAAGASVADLEELKRKEELLNEIQTIRKSLDILKADTPAPSSSDESRRPSLTSKRTLSIDYLTVPPASHLRPPRQQDPRGRVQSMGLSTMSRSSPYGVGLGRPTSVPIQEDDWDSYVRDRKLLQPPSGVSAPIPTTPVSPVPMVPVSPAVAEALLQRQRRESSHSYGRAAHSRGGSMSSVNMLDRLTPDGLLAISREVSGSSRKDSSSDDVPAVLREHGQHRKTSSQSNIPVTILPPKPAPRPQSPEQNRTWTFEELDERHRQKLRQLQAPLTAAETEQAAFQDAKMRWEKAKAVEKEQVTKRQAQKVAALNKEAAKRADREASGRRSMTLADTNRRSRTLSVDALASVPTAAPTSKRMSTLKVEDWQKHQQDVGKDAQPAEKAARRKSGVPFPDFQPADTELDRRRVSTVRDPPS